MEGGLESARDLSPADAFVYRPEGERQWPGVLHLTGIGDSEGVFRKRSAELTSPLTPETIAGDAANYVDVLARHAAALP
jgi:hypothetical protein